MKKLTKSSPLKYDPPNENTPESSSLGASAGPGSTSAWLGDSPIFTGNANSSIGSGFVDQPAQGTFSTGVYPVRGGGSGGPTRGEDGPSIEFSNVCRPVYVLEKHMSVIRKGPTTSPKLEMYSWEDDDDVNEDDLITVETSFTGDQMLTIPYQATDGEDISVFYSQEKDILEVGIPGVLTLPIDVVGENLDWENNMVLVITHQFQSLDLALHWSVIQLAFCKVLHYLYMVVLLVELSIVVVFLCNFLVMVDTI